MFVHHRAFVRSMSHRAITSSDQPTRPGDRRTGSGRSPRRRIRQIVAGGDAAPLGLIRHPALRSELRERDTTLFQVFLNSESDPALEAGRSFLLRERLG
jgi:hypothetical protein